MKNKDLKRQIIDISYRHTLSHLGSCLTAVDVIADIYQQMIVLDQKHTYPQPVLDHVPFVLSSGHAGLALYVVLQKYGFGDAEEMLKRHGVHPNRNVSDGIWCSTGSLGQGLPIAVGMAMANRTRDIYCLMSDGECAEGSIWEALRIADENGCLYNNLHVHLNMNGWAAYQEVKSEHLALRLEEYPVWIHRTSVRDFPFLYDQDAHYHVMNEEEYTQALEILK